MAFSFQIYEIEISYIMADTFSEAIGFLELCCLSTWIHTNYKRLWGPIRALAHLSQWRLYRSYSVYKTFFSIILKF